jgi:RNA polymerase sigma-70 factor (ECF subfamily)
VVLTQTTGNETDLIEKAKQGDRSAFGELVLRYYPGVVKVVYHLCGDTRLAEDMAQEAFLRAWINLPSFHPQSSLRNWLYRIAVNAALDVLRRRPEDQLEEEAVQMLADQTVGPETALIEKEQMVLIPCRMHPAWSWSCARLATSRTRKLPACWMCPLAQSCPA